MNTYDAEYEQAITVRFAGIVIDEERDKRYVSGPHYSSYIAEQANLATCRKLGLGGDYRTGVVYWDERELLSC